MAEMGSKISVFKDPYLDRATESDNLMMRIKELGGIGGSSDLTSGTGLGGRNDMLRNLRGINDELKAKADRLNELRKRRDDLDARRQKKKGIDELRTGLQKACCEYDKMADDLEQQVSDIESIT